MVSAKLVCEVMHKGLVACWADESLVEVARRLCDDSIHAIFVLNQNGHVRGIVSQTDLAAALVEGDWQDLTAGEVMTPDVVTIFEDTPLEIAAEVMLNRNIHRLLVVQQDNPSTRPVGVLSFSDITCEMAGS